MDHEVLTAAPETDQEEVARILARYHLLAVPVVDVENHLLGIVTVDDVVDVIEEEATEDIYRLAQGSEEAVIFSPLPRAVRARLPWLVVNLGTAFISSTVVAQYAGHCVYRHPWLFNLSGIGQLFCRLAGLTLATLGPPRRLLRHWLSASQWRSWRKMVQCPQAT